MTRRPDGPSAAGAVAAPSQSSGHRPVVRTVDPADALAFSDVVAEAARVLAGGGLVALPTDTVYGLACDPFRPGAAARVFAAKGRPRGVPLPVLVASVEQADEVGGPFSAVTERLVARFWPGPLTVVVSRRPGVAADLGDEGGTIGLRLPDHVLVRALCAEAGPLATTSANRHGQPPAVTAAEVVEAVGGHVPLVLDGGRCEGEPSTVVDLTGPRPRLVRPGRLPWDAIEAVVGDGPGD
ncbi:MAG: L-threonylcarbamoyladenylate synthase [Actinomycetota bacterium]